MTAAVEPRSIPFFNYKGAFTAREGEYVAIFRDIIRRGAFIQQRDLREFEQREPGPAGKVQNSQVGAKGQVLEQEGTKSGCPK